MASAAIVSGLLFVACSHLNKGRIPAQAYDSQRAVMYAGTTLTVKKGILSFANLTGKEIVITKSCQHTYSGSTVTCDMEMVVPAHKAYTLKPGEVLTVDRYRDNNAVFFLSTTGRRVMLKCARPDGNGKTEWIPVTAYFANNCFKHPMSEGTEILFTNPPLEAQPIRYEAPAQDNAPIEI